MRDPENADASCGHPETLAVLSGLPQVRVPEKGAPLVLGANNVRVQALRERLGLAPAGGFDAALAERVAAFQRVHGLPVDGKAGTLTLAALNKGAVHYERKLLMNMERISFLRLRWQVAYRLLKRCVKD